MTSELLEPRAWSKARMTAWVGLVFATQLVLVFWLAERNPIPLAPLPTISGFRQVPLAQQTELVLESPTVFALPDTRGFSGEAWMRPSAPPVRPFDWSEPPRWLPLDGQHLGGGFTPLVSANSFALDPILARPTPELALPVIAREPLFPPQSLLRLGRGLEQRKLERTAGDLPSWPSSEVLTKSVVQVAIDQEGRVISATLLQSSTLRAADSCALERAWELTFSRAAPELLETGPKLTLGELIFEWHAVAPPQAAGTKP